MNEKRQRSANRTPLNYAKFLRFHDLVAKPVPIETKVVKLINRHDLDEKCQSKTNT